MGTMGLEAKSKKKKTCDEISDMARFISGVLGSYDREADERILEHYHESWHYNTRVFDILDEDLGAVKIRYNGRLVFSHNGFRAYCRSGSWEEQFERLYSRAIKESERRTKLDLSNLK